MLSSGAESLQKTLKQKKTMKGTADITDLKNIYISERHHHQLNAAGVNDKNLT